MRPGRRKALDRALGRQLPAVRATRAGEMPLRQFGSLQTFTVKDGEIITPVTPSDKE